MEPIGTITNFYPFLSEDTRKIVESVLKDAEGFEDFVSRLVDIVVDQAETNDFSYFSTIQVWLTQSKLLFNRLRKRLIEHEILRPWAFYFLQGNQVELSYDDFPNSIQKALEASPENWVRVHLLMVGAWFTRDLQRQRYLDEADELIEKYPELSCFSAEISIRRGWVMRFEGDIQGAMNQFEQATEIAEDYNDILRMADARADYSASLKESDIFGAITQLEESYQIFKSIGATSWTINSAGNMGLFHTIIGEYDLAAEFYIEANRISQQTDWPKLATSVVLIRVYCDIDLPEEALEWIKWKRDCEDITPQILEDIISTEGSLFLLATARTLIQLGQHEMVPSLLSEAQNKILRRGDEVGLLTYNFVSGLLELALGNQDEGMQSIASALAEAERLNYQVSVNSTLIALAKAEVRNSKRTGSKGDIESSGPWMTRLEIHARERNYPGIKMQHALLKSEYQEKIGESEAALLTLQDALTFTDSLGVKTLRKRILKRLDELETSVKA